MENFADLPSIEGDDWPGVIVETASPRPAAQIWPSRPEPAANLAEQDSQPGIFSMSLMTVCGCEETLTLIGIAEMYPLLSSAMTVRV
jgi:hypothetical protein